MQFGDLTSWNVNSPVFMFGVGLIDFFNINLKLILKLTKRLLAAAVARKLTLKIVTWIFFGCFKYEKGFCQT